jgi:ectoine hydroxylase-related dioxygenase (phytanoyl-CoA dioxygenase family)
MFVAFVYLTDVFPGDGGLVVIPGSHKAEVERPKSLFVPLDGNSDPDPHPGFANITPRAGDVVLISELLTHGILHWRPKDRDRRFLVLRYQPQYLGQGSFPPAILERLSPETRELAESAFHPRQRNRQNGQGHADRVNQGERKFALEEPGGTDRSSWPIARGISFPAGNRGWQDHLLR